MGAYPDLFSKEGRLLKGGMIAAVHRFLTAEHSPWDTIILGLASLVLFVPFMGLAPLFDYDEANFAEAAREMLVTGNFLQVTIGFEPFFEKPPLFFWIQAASMAAFGVGEWAARLPNGLIGVATLLVLFRIGSQFYDRQFGYFWVIAYAASILPGLYFRTGIIDPLFNLLMFLSIWNLIQWDMEQGKEGARHGSHFILYAGLFSGLAVLTKGPVGFGMVMLNWLVFWGLFRRASRPPIKEVIIFAVISIAVGASWFIAEILLNGPAFIGAFVEYQRRLLLFAESGHGQPFYYHFVTTLIGCFPASIVAFGGLRPPAEMSDWKRTFHRWMVVVFCCVLIVFSLVTTKILHYVSLAYIPLAYFAAVGMHSLLRGGHQPTMVYRIALIILGSVWAAALIGLPVAMMWKDSWAGLITRPFVHANVLAVVRWSALDVIPGVVLLTGILGAIACFARRRWIGAHMSLFAGVAVAIALLLPMAAPKIHEHTQGAMVRFFRLAGEQDAYVRTLFHSYALYFYSRMPPERSAASRNIPSRQFLEWLKAGPIDRPAYFVARTGDAGPLVSTAVKISEENGYVLFKRDPPAVLSGTHVDER